MAIRHDWLWFLPSLKHPSSKKQESWFPSVPACLTALTFHKGINNSSQEPFALNTFHCAQTNTLSPWHTQIPDFWLDRSSRNFYPKQGWKDPPRNHVADIFYIPKVTVQKVLNYQTPQSHSFRSPRHCPRQLLIRWPVPNRSECAESRWIVLKSENYQASTPAPHDPCTKCHVNMFIIQYTAGYHYRVDPDKNNTYSISVVQFYD